MCIIVFGCIADNGGDNQTCFINNGMSGSQGPCILGLFVGVMGFLICLGFLIIDYLFELSNNLLVRKWFVVADIAVSGLWGFFCLVAFAVMTNSWRNNDVVIYPSKVVNGIRAAIAFSFFAIFGFVIFYFLLRGTVTILIVWLLGSSGGFGRLPTKAWRRSSVSTK